MLASIDRMLRRWKYGDPIIVVSGLPRSGTSMMMKMLEVGGISPLTDHVRSPDVDNPKGYFEYERVKHLENDPDKSWVQRARGKALKVISFLLKDLPDDNHYKVVFMKRRLEEVVASQNKMLDHRGEDNEISDHRTRELYRKHLPRAYAVMRARPNFEMLEVDYNRALEDPRAVAREVDDFVGGGLDLEAMADVVDPRLYRNRAELLASETES